MANEYKDTWTMQNLGEDKLYNVFGDVGDDANADADPPPPFEDSHRAPYPQEKPTQQVAGSAKSDGANTSTAPAYPMQPHHTPSPVLTLPIQYTNWIGNYIQVLPNADEDAVPMYIAHATMSKPHLTLSEPSSTKSSTSSNFKSGSQFGAVTYHYTSFRIDLTLNGHPIQLTTTGKLKSRYTYTSPTLGGRQLTWRFRKGMSTDLLLTDNETGALLARFHFGGFYWMKRGRMEVFVPEVVGEKGSVATEGEGRALLEELVTTCIAVVHLCVWVSYTAIV